MKDVLLVFIIPYSAINRIWSIQQHASHLPANLIALTIKKNKRKTLDVTQNSCESQTFCCFRKLMIKQQLLVGLLTMFYCESLAMP